MSKVGLLENESVLTLGGKKAEIELSKTDEASVQLKKRRERDRKRAIYFKVGFTNYWRKPIHKMINKVKANFPSLKWLRVSMSYH